MDNRRNDKTVGIIGGAGAIGRVVDRYFQALGYETVISDPQLEDGPTLGETLNRCKIIYISVFPISAVAGVMGEIAARPDAADFIVLENSSVKSELLDATDALLTAGASFCATHPLCKADQPWKNQNVLLIPVGDRSAAAEGVAHELYETAQMNITEVASLKEHDELMAVLQLVPHLVLRVISKVFTDLKLDINMINSAATANFKLFYLSFWRVLVQSPVLSASIIERLLQQKKGQEIYTRLIEGMVAVLRQDMEALADQFQLFYDHAQVSDDEFERMNQQGIVTLERLANLDRRSLSISAQADRVGLLREILLPFEELKVNLNAIDSHMITDTEIRFDIGYDPVSDEILNTLCQQLNAMGHIVEIHD